LERKAKLEREQARKDAFVEKCLTIGGLFIVGGGIGFI
jgi:cyanophycinase-like exopeptidase